VLGAGYQMGWKKFTAAAALAGIILTGELAKHVIKTYRATNHKIKRFWRELENAAYDAVCDPGKVFTAGENGRIKFQVKAGFLRMKLPSGRWLFYCRPKLETRMFKWEDDDGVEHATTKTVVCYWAQDPTNCVRLARSSSKTSQTVCSRGSGWRVRLA
jgi:DNA polymerase